MRLRSAGSRRAVDRASASSTSPPRPACTFRHNSGAYGGKLLPETLGSGCAFLDYDADGWQDILLVNGMDWPGHKRQRSTLRLYRNNRNGTFTDVTRAAGLDVEMYGMGVAVGDFNNDGVPRPLHHLRRPEPPVPQHRQGHVRRRHARQRPRRPRRRSARPRCGSTSIATACSICSSATTSGGRRSTTCSAASTASRSRTARPRRTAARPAGCSATAATARSRTSPPRAASSTRARSRSASRCIDHDQDGWPDIFVANDTQPNKLYRNQRNGTFKDVALEAGVALSDDGKARAGMGVDAADFDNSGRARPGGHQLRQRDDRALPLAGAGHSIRTSRATAGVGAPSRNRLGFGCVFADLDLDGALDLVVANGHIDDTVRNIRGNVGYAQPPQLFLNQGNGDVPRRGAGSRAAAFAQPRVGRGLAVRRLRPRRRRRPADDDQQRPAGAVPQRSDRRQPQPPVPAARAPRRTATRSARPSASSTAARRRSRMVQERVELSVAVRAAGDVRRRPPRSRRPRRHRPGRAGGPRSSRTSRRARPTTASRGRGYGRSRPYTTDVQCGHRVAFTGIFDRQKGQSRIGVSATGSFIRLICRTSRNRTKATIRNSSTVLRNRP